MSRRLLPLAGDGLAAAVYWVAITPAAMLRRWVRALRSRDRETTPGSFWIERGGE